MQTRINASILLAAGANSELDAYAAALEAAGFSVTRANTRERALEFFFRSAPRCIVLEEQFLHLEGASLLDDLKRTNLYGHIPCIVLFAEPPANLDWELVVADDYLAAPFAPQELLSRVRLSLARSQRDVNANPLTNLPGSLSTMRGAEHRLISGACFAFGYFDIDYFKAYNDKYGFHRGDEVLRMTGRLLLNTALELCRSDASVGHVGGDDFILTIPCEAVHEVCGRICREFDEISAAFYDEEDRSAGIIRGKDRQGNPTQFKLMSCSIGVVDTRVTQVAHISDLSARASEMKSYAKQLPGSNYIVDRRH